MEFRDDDGSVVARIVNLATPAAEEAVARALCAMDVTNQFLTPAQKQLLIDTNWPHLLSRARGAIEAFTVAMAQEQTRCTICGFVVDTRYEAMDARGQRAAG